jgi:nucleotide sugar dehydrogenase
MPAQDVLVIGLGYVGLPLAVQAARAGFQVTGFDISAVIAAGLSAGRSHVDDVPPAEVVEARARGFLATSDEAEIGPQDVIVICVPTPLSTADGPDLGAVRAAAETAGRLLRPGTLVSLESTTYPGTTDEVVRPLLEKGSGLTAGIDFSLVFSPSGSTRATRSTAWSTRRRSSAASPRRARTPPPPSTARSASRWSARPRRARRRWPSCWKTPTGT